MSAEIIDLDSRRLEDHLTGGARCLACGHEWIAVAPVGMDWLDCPACTLEFGRLVRHVGCSEPHWSCDCGNYLFYVTPLGPYCPVCGVYQRGADFDPPPAAA